jgi:hypothetical protein
MSDDDLIRRGDALYAIAGWEIPSTAIAALPAVSAPSLTFGEGKLVIDTGTHYGKPAVFIAPAKMPGEVGTFAKREGNPKDQLVSGEIFFTFPTEEQAQRVADALCNSPDAPDVAELVEALRWAHDRLHEINENNYDHADVCELNAASVEVILGLRTALSKIGETK